MPNKNKEYFFVDVDLNTMRIVDWGESDTANHTGKTDDPNVHRIFLTKGQYNKFVKQLD